MVTGRCDGGVGERWQDLAITLGEALTDLVLAADRVDEVAPGVTHVDAVVDVRPFADVLGNIGALMDEFEDGGDPAGHLAWMRQLAACGTALRNVLASDRDGTRDAAIDLAFSDSVKALISAGRLLSGDIEPRGPVQ